MSILSITVETADHNAVCEVADMLRRLIASESDYGYGSQHGCKCGNAGEPTVQMFPDSPVVHPFGIGVQQHPVRGTLYTDAGEINMTPQQQYVPPTHPTTASILSGQGVPGYDGVPFDINTSTGSPVIVPVPPTIITSGVKLDGEGLPWDRRIHASTKTFRQSDNTWKMIRGVADTLVDQVKAELRTAMGQVQPVAAVPPTPPAPPVLTLVPPAPPAPPLPNMDNDKGWPDPPAGPVAAAVPPVPPAPPVADPYTDFVQFCTSNQQSGRLAFEVIKGTCEKYGITQLPMLNARHDLIPTIRTELESLCSK